MSARPAVSGKSHSRISTTLELALLGPLEARDDGEPVDLGGARPRSLLALLALNLGRPLSADRIVEELWGEESPRSARHMVAVYTSRLRKGLGDGVVITRRTGYELGVEPDHIDVVRFERLSAEGREALAVGDPASAASSFSAGLALWKGPALADFAYEPFAQAEIARLEELRLQAEEEWIDADLALQTNAAALVADLEAFVAAQPLRERRRAQLMLALYRSGRQADALAAYQDARRVLLDELGIEPGPELRGLERSILAQDEHLLAAAPSAVVAPRPESRRTVTVVVAQLSEPLSEHEDPELSRSATRAGLERVRIAAARYGGAAEELPDGDLLVVFGSPRAHDDDCVRALQATGDLRAQGVVARAGVDTGETVVKADDAIRGPVVRTAARLKAMAAPGDILVSRSIGQLAGEVARLEPVDAVGATGFRLLDLVPNIPPRPLRLDVPLIGRSRELAELERLFARTVDEQRAQLVTVVGEPGIGKSRLAHELGEALARDALVLRGRCLAYGEGMTYWPLREIVSGAAGDPSQAAVAGLLAGEESAESIAERIASVVGDSETTHPVEEIRSAVRHLLVRLSQERPVLVVIDDAHWAEPTFVDLIEHLVESNGRAPMLVLCLARPEFLEHRSLRTAVTLALEGLTRDESAELLVALAPVSPQSDGDQIVEAAAGNPLFLEQLAAFSAERRSVAGHGVPPASLRSLLSARLDVLGPGERAVLEGASVLGREFETKALADLLPAEARPTLKRHIEVLTLKGLIERDRSPAPFEEAFRFRHILIQETAYRSLPMARRAALHERVADRIERREHAASPDVDQIIGYHLEQAHRYCSDLGATDDELRILGRRAGDRLVAAGRRALGREDDPAAVNLLDRAVALLPDPGARLVPSILLGEALESTGRYEKAYSLLEATIEEAKAIGDVRSEWLAVVQSARLGTRVAPKSWTDERLNETASRALQVFEALEDDLGLMRSWMLSVESSWVRARFDEAAESGRRALEYAERTADEREILHVHEWLCAALLYGSAHIDLVRREFEALLERAGGRPGKTVAFLIACASTDAMRGDAAGARRHYARAKSLAAETGLASQKAVTTLFSEEVGLLFGDAEFTERETRTAYEELEEGGDKGVRSTIGALLAEALYQLGRYDEAESVVDEARALAASDDLATQVPARAVKAKLLALRGELDEAERLAREAFELASDTDALYMRGSVSMSCAEVFALAGRTDEAKDALREAVEVSERKGNIVMARQAHTRLAEL